VALFAIFSLAFFFSYSLSASFDANNSLKFIFSRLFSSLKIFLEFIIDENWFSWLKSFKAKYKDINRKNITKNK